MRSGLIIASALVALALPMAAQAQGVARGAQDGARDGRSVAGAVPVGGVKGVLGIPQRTGVRRSHRRAYYHRRRR
jgi:hypothetical protein